MSSPYQAENRLRACKDIQGSCRWLLVIASVSGKDINYQRVGGEMKHEGLLFLASSKAGCHFSEENKIMKQEEHNKVNVTS